MDNSIPKAQNRQLFGKKAPFLPCFARRLEKLCIFGEEFYLKKLKKLKKSGESKKSEKSKGVKRKS